MATYSVNAYISSTSLTAEQLLAWVGAASVSASATEVRLRQTDSVSGLQFPGDYDIILTGTFTVVGGLLQSGTINQISGREPNGAVDLATVSGVSINVANHIGAGGVFASAPGPANLFSGVDDFNGANLNDQLLGYGNADTISGGAGNDTIRGMDGADTLIGNTGNDVFEYVVPGHIDAGETISGGQDTDTIRILDTGVFDFLTNATVNSIEVLDFAQSSGITTAIIGNAAATGGSIVTFDGSGGVDALIMKTSVDNINLPLKTFTNWDDSVDTITIDAQASVQDLILSGALSEATEILAGSGNDHLNGGSAADNLEGGEGNDIFRYSGNATDPGEIISGGNGVDTILMTGFGTSIFSGYTITSIEALDFDQPSGTAEARFLGTQIGAGQIASVNGSASTDVVQVNGQNIDLAGVIFQNWSSADFILMDGTAQNDSLTGSALNDEIEGGIGRDIINGGNGADTIDGGEGEDTIDAGGDNDIIRINGPTDFDIAGNAFTESINGGDGIDTLVVASAGDYAFNTGTLASIEKLDISGAGLPTNVVNITFGNDGQIGPNGIQQIISAPGSNNIRVERTILGDIDLRNVSFSNWGSNDSVTINAIGNNSGLSFYGANQATTIIDAGGSNTLVGGSAADILNAGAGGDTLDGGAGADQLNGEGGNDTFRYTAASQLATAGEAVNGGSETDTIRLDAAAAFDFRSATITAVERLQFNQSSGTAIALMAGTHLGGPASGLMSSINGSAATDILRATGALVDLSAVTFGAWTNAVDVIEVIGTNGNDILTGTSLDDLIDGLGGTDVIMAGAGNDTISFNALSTTILAGPGSNDAATFYGQTNGLRAYDLNAASLESLMWYTNNNLYLLLASSGGTRIETVNDIAGTELFNSRMTILDSSLREELVDIYSDTGTRVVYDYDPSNQAIWDIRIQSYSSTPSVAFALDFTDTRYDDLSRVVRDEDQGDQQLWDSITTTYTSAGAVDYQDNQYDDGSRIIFDGDQDSAFLWTSVSTTYAPGGAVDYQDTAYDDGRRVIYDSDQANAFIWSTQQTSYAAGNLLDVQDTYYDDNTRVIFDWDQGSQFTWKYFESFYNAAGNLTTQRITQDDNSVVIFNF